ncbi:hypothetical protein NBC2815_02111 [Xanthomonas fragariae]|nr:hypothetical protein NBC2815_02111 [Xanthomonas fragariae]
MQKRDPAHQPTQVVAGGATKHVQRIALGAFEPTTTQPAVFFQMPGHRFHCLTSFDPAPWPSRQGLGLATMQHPHVIHLAPAIVQINDRHGWLDAHNPRVCSSCSTKVSPSYGLPEKLRAPIAGADCNTDLDAECVRLTRFALADAVHFRRMRRTANTDFPSIVRRPLHRKGRMHARDKANLPSNALAVRDDRQRQQWPASATKAPVPTRSTASVGSAAPSDDARSI